MNLEMGQTSVGANNLRSAFSGTTDVFDGKATLAESSVGRR